MTEDPPRRGRPPGGAEVKSTPVNVRLSPRDYDRAHAQASAERRSVPDLMRRAVDRYLAAPPRDDDDDR